jgi:hypothetical protein
MHSDAGGGDRAVSYATSMYGSYNLQFTHHGQLYVRVNDAQ